MIEKKKVLEIIDRASESGIINTALIKGNIKSLPDQIAIPKIDDMSIVALQEHIRLCNQMLNRKQKEIENAEWGKVKIAIKNYIEKCGEITFSTKEEEYELEPEDISSVFRDIGVINLDYYK